MGQFFLTIKNVQSFPLKLKTALHVSKVTPENILKPLMCMNASSFISRMVKVQHHLQKWITKTGITFRKLCQKIGRNYLTISFKCSMNTTEWFPEGASSLDKEHISQVMLEQAEAIRMKVTNAFSKLFSCLHGIYFGCSL